jgi:hypothetical protein
MIKIIKLHFAVIAYFFKLLITFFLYVPHVNILHSTWDGFRPLDLEVKARITCSAQSKMHFVKLKKKDLYYHSRPHPGAFIV